MDGIALNPAQGQVIELLGRGAGRSELPDDLAVELRNELHDALDHLRHAFDASDPVWVSKHAVAAVHGCEARYLAGQGTFEWTLASVRGRVVHKAIEYSVNWRGEPVAADLVDEALARIADDDMNPARRFVASLDEFDRADLRGQAVDLVTKFQECFPPLRSKWTPVTESRVVFEAFDGGLVLSGKTDLTLGKPGQKVIVDLKSGRAMPVHRDDLRFYALIELFRLGVAPRKVATYSLDAARAYPEDITEPVLRSALRRTVDAVERIAAITSGGEEPGRRPGPHCRWCPLQDECDVGKAALARADSDDDSGEPPW